MICGGWALPAQVEKVHLNYISICIHKDIVLGKQIIEFFMTFPDIPTVILSFNFLLLLYWPPQTLISLSHFPISLLKFLVHCCFPLYSLSWVPLYFSFCVYSKLHIHLNIWNWKPKLIGYMWHLCFWVWTTRPNSILFSFTHLSPKFVFLFFFLTE